MGEWSRAPWLPPEGFVLAEIVPDVAATVDDWLGPREARGDSLIAA